MTTKPRSSRIGRLLVLYRATQQQGVRELSHEIGISAATLSRIERGHAMDADTPAEDVGVVERCRTRAVMIYVRSGGGGSGGGRIGGSRGSADFAASVLGGSPDA